MINTKLYNNDVIEQLQAEQLERTGSFYHTFEHDLQKINSKFQEGMRVISVDPLECVSIDLDKNDEASLCRSLNLAVGTGLFKAIEYVKSSSGNYHIYCAYFDHLRPLKKLKRDFNPSSHRTIAVDLGSDPVREMTAQMQFEKEHPWPWIMFESDENTKRLMKWEMTNWRTLRDRTDQIMRAYQTLQEWLEKKASKPSPVEAVDDAEETMRWRESNGV